ncbi:MAG: hypothetical protein Q8883_02585, partial [Sweet potato little leaf phytoplasma]|nr:hypothetical protein [Sweet potato little leaf phytoplasma]
GRTGEPYDNSISVGILYMLKLSHMVEDKIHARNVVESIREDENLKLKQQVWTNLDRTQNNVEFFFSSNIGHSLMRDVKIFGRELMDDRHH